MAIAKTLVLSTIISCAVMAAPAAAETSEKFSSKIDVKKNADGTYESEVTTDSTDAAGTRVKREETQERSKTLTGNTKTVTEMTTTVDPKGMMNKRQETIEQTVKSDGEGNSDRELNSKGVDAAGTLHKRSIETETEVKSNGNMVITQEDKKVTDPKGLANKTVVKTEIEKVKAPDGSTVSAKVKRKVNGEVVQDQVQ